MAGRQRGCDSSDGFNFLYFILRLSARCRGHNTRHWQSAADLPTTLGPETWLCRSWAVDSSFTGWAGGTAPSALARLSGVITKGGMGGLATVGPALPLPRYQGESKAAAALGATAAGRVSVKLPNGS